MARHGYLREYDEAPDRGDNRDEDWSERNRGFMFDRDRSGDEDRNHSSRMSEPGRSSFREDDREWRERQGNDWRSRSYGSSYGRGGFEDDFNPSGGRADDVGRNDWERSPRNFSSRQDDHYLSWRDRQIRSLDQDYADYCREREQQFHSEFDNWRRSRQQPGRQSNAIGEEAELELTQERALAGEGNTPSPVGEATLGTSNSENTSRGRR